LYEIVKTVANQLENANGEDIKGESWWNNLEWQSWNLFDLLKIQRIESYLVSTRFESIKWMNCILPYFRSSLRLLLNWMPFEWKWIDWQMIWITSLHISFTEWIFETNRINVNRSDELHCMKSINYWCHESDLMSKLIMKSDDQD
jgi:hypothetical protein